MADVSETLWEPFGEHALSHGWKIDGSGVAWWATKPQAVAAAQAIGFRAKDVGRVWTRFQCGWAIIDGRFGVMRKPAYAALRAARRAAGEGR